VIWRRWRKDIFAALAVVVFVAAILAFRAAYIEPRIWGAACVAAQKPTIVCIPRAGLLWGQRFDIWGGGALGLGAIAFFTRAGGLPTAAAAIALGIAAIANYNASFGAIGVALGVLAWVSPRAARR